MESPQRKCLVDTEYFMMEKCSHWSILEEKCILNAMIRIRPKFEQAGSHSHGKMPYFSVPDSVMDDFDELIPWANESIRLSK